MIPARQATKNPGFQIYFLDKNWFLEADKSFWVRGESRAEFLIKTDRPMKRLVLTLSAGPHPVTVHARVGGREQELVVRRGGFPRHHLRARARLSVCRHR